MCYFRLSGSICCISRDVRGAKKRFQMLILARHSFQRFRICNPALHLYVLAVPNRLGKVGDSEGTTNELQKAEGLMN